MSDSAIGSGDDVGQQPIGLPQAPIVLPEIPGPGELQDPHEFDQLPFELGSPAEPPIASVVAVESGPADAGVVVGAAADAFRPR